jgi:hypothetical protein
VGQRELWEVLLPGDDTSAATASSEPLPAQSVRDPATALSLLREAVGRLNSVLGSLVPNQESAAAYGKELRSDWGDAFASQAEGLGGGLVFVPGHPPQLRFDFEKLEEILGGTAEGTPTDFLRAGLEVVDSLDETVERVRGRKVATATPRLDQVEKAAVHETIQLEPGTAEAAHISLRRLVAEKVISSAAVTLNLDDEGDKLAAVRAEKAKQAYGPDQKKGGAGGGPKLPRPPGSSGGAGGPRVGGAGTGSGSGSGTGSGGASARITQRQLKAYTG